MLFLENYDNYIEKIDIGLDELALIISNKFGYNQAVFLSKGSFGVIYDIGNGRLLKFTNSLEEIHIVKTLIGENLEYIANYYYVSKLSSNKYRLKQEGYLRYPRISELYIIIMEKLVNTDKAEVIMEKLFDEIEKNINSKKILQIKEILKRIDLFKNLNLSEQSSIAYNDLIKIKYELGKYGISNRDGHIKNYGYKNNHLAIFDVIDKKRRKDLVDYYDIDESLSI